ncbi:dihydrolipoamide branched chain transacylase E2 [Naegleria gruberi]|uniref:Dihydrolipoamide acetyltransferase component of pyruvate dehydrogenase complex n=1 Tax=Naegleria gruberi TaxID=5762 RepID=D2V498_NAEGR|nr:dihydrolipoamide branched chain transacylase E2 [Naegleria gruberi]EFC48345.1 dihydrolipoamide branched chain transacylase E2 [Naegleria gruberi]|eukprot:XP_002681089.1 dihydrolipoamide branched chain transacylase E2 [Naegleria gruberi strain NEG-M]
MQFHKNLARTLISATAKKAATTSARRGGVSMMVASGTINSSSCNKKVNFGSTLVHQSGVVTSSIKNYHTTNSNKKVVPFLLADIGEGITKVEVVKWFIKEGDHIEQFQNVAEVMSDKANVEISSRFDGIVKKLCYKVGDIANVGAPLIEIEVADSTASPTASTPSSTSTTETKTTTTTSSSTSCSSSDLAEASFGKTLTTPAVRRIARENNIDLTKVQATGRNGRVLKEDVLSYLENPTKHTEKQSEKVAAVPEQTTTAAPSTPVVGDRREPVRGLMRTMIKTMNAATKVPHFGYKDEVYVDNLMTLRNHLKKTAERQGVKLSYMPFIIKAVSLALKEYPVLNSSLSEDESEIIYKGEHNIGVAMDTPNGLLVPNIKSVQNKSILEIAAELNRLQELGKQGKLGSNDLRGGTFTLSNIGTIGGTYADPILSIPEVCIGAIGMIKKTATFDSHNNVVPKHIMYMSWAADHRVVDGATMARFSNVWKEYLENPDNFIVALK